MGNEKNLGRKLLIGFFQNLINKDNLPNKMIFIGNSVNLTCKNDDIILKLLKQFENKGVEIISCITCTEHFGLTQVNVGKIGKSSDFINIYMNNEFQVINIS
jgi:hypothetical protein